MQKDYIITHMTAAYGDHTMFVEPFIFFVNKFRPGDRIEIITNNRRLLSKNSPPLTRPGVIIRKPETDVRVPNSVRFLTTPYQVTEYTYITDIDIMLMEDNFDSHIKEMKKCGVPYNNIVRKGTKKATGLHFVKTFQFFGAVFPYYNDVLSLQGGDEHMLHELLRAGFRHEPAVVLKNCTRPVHGLHMSLNRKPTAEVCGWNHKRWRDTILKINDTSEWKAYMARFCQMRFIRLWRKAVNLCG